MIPPIRECLLSPTLEVFFSSCLPSGGPFLLEEASCSGSPLRIRTPDSLLNLLISSLPEGRLSSFNLVTPLQAAQRPLLSLTSLVISFPPLSPSTTYEGLYLFLIGDPAPYCYKIAFTFLVVFIPPREIQFSESISPSSVFSLFFCDFSHADAAPVLFAICSELSFL